MNYISTRDMNTFITLSDAIRAGLAKDGGLVIPASIPKINFDDYAPELSIPKFAHKILHHFFEHDPLDEKLLAICEEAFTIPIPLKQINHNTFILELFHGPTSSFKDFGARFLAGCLNALSEHQKTTIIVATSGDTGSAVASAFYQKANINVIILYPLGQISERQQHQITCWDKNILALAVDGTFDDCQRLVKTAFQDPWWKTNISLGSANSINIGRLLPQIVYYAFSSLEFYRRYQLEPGFIVPTGNLGNATAGFYAKLMGFPIREIVLSTNANTVIPDYIHSGKYQPRPSINTLANAMDVGDPSNFERLSQLFNNFDLFKANVKAISVNDDEIRDTIKKYYAEDNIIICPHTATACFARQQLSAEPWIVVATADPSKFDTVIEPLIGSKISIPPALHALLDKPVRASAVVRTLDDIKERL